MIDPSKDKFAYFKDNIQTAEDKEFDASQYYYHREDMSGNKTGAGMVPVGVGASGMGGAAALSLSSYGMANAMASGLGGAQQGVFAGGFPSAGIMGGAAANSFLAGATPRGSLTGGLPSGAHDLHRMNSSEHLTAVMKNRNFPLQPETKAPDMSEFPALSRTNSWALDQTSETSSTRSQQSEFVIQKEDFPALSPFGNSSGSSSGPNSIEKSAMQEHAELKRHASFHSSANDSMVSQRPSGPGGNTLIGSRAGASAGSAAALMSAVGSSNTSASNVNLGNTGAFGPLHGSRPGAPASNGQLDPSNQYGLLGMLHTVIRPSNDAKKNLLMGCDLTSLGLNLNAAEPLHPVFASPWAEGPLTKEPQFTLPMCYYNQPPALKTTHLSKFHLETLFYIFYSMPKDVLQAYAAQELYSRDWRYHTELKMWLKRATPADSALFANGSATAGSLLASSTASGPSTSGSIGAIGSIGSASSSSVASSAALGSLGPQFLYFDTNTWERRVFTGSIHSLSAGLLSEEEIRVKFNAAS